MKTFIFDLDDTLMANQHLYSLAQIEFLKLCSNIFETKMPSAPSILKLQEELDLKGVKRKGFSKERFPTSFQETLAVLAERVPSIRVNSSDYNDAYQIGMKVFDERFWPKYLIPYADKALTHLLLQKDNLHLLTTGDPEVQQKKVEFYKLNDFYFGKNINIVPRGKSEKIEEICKDLDKRNVWFVGNSKKSDIKPALEARIGAIYIPQETWGYDEHTLDGVDKTRLTTLENIGQIIDIYDSLT